MGQGEIASEEDKMVDFVFGVVTMVVVVGQVNREVILDQRCCFLIGIFAD